MLVFGPKKTPPKAEKLKVEVDKMEGAKRVFFTEKPDYTPQKCALGGLKEVLDRTPPGLF